MSETQLYDSHFTITTVDTSKYDRVSRITGTSMDSTTVMTLDINSDLYPVATNESIQLVLASTLSIDGSLNKDMAAGSAGGAGWRDVAGTGGQGVKSGPGAGGRGVNGVNGAAAEQGGNLADMFDYVCRGKIYRFEQGGEENL
ncbi:MAG: DNA-directed RNA polymerases I, II, and III subunit RPABC3 [Alyxoria varia]|nr:MAG: DNA-directed RNA polymerases I, II, and III subunit RPABC3 [Alyxoria varia]